MVIEVCISDWICTISYWTFLRSDRITIPSMVTNFVIGNSQSVQKLFVPLQCKSQIQTKKKDIATYPSLKQSN